MPGGRPRDLGFASEPLKDGHCELILFEGSLWPQGIGWIRMHQDEEPGTSVLSIVNGAKVLLSIFKFYYFKCILI